MRSARGRLGAQHHGQLPAGLDRAQIRHAEPELSGPARSRRRAAGSPADPGGCSDEVETPINGRMGQSSAICGIWAHGQTASLAVYRLRPHVQPVHLLHVQAEAGASARQGGPEGHLAVVLPGREDRRARLQRRRQVDAAADHGREGHRVPRRGAARARRHRRAARAGAAARRGQGRARQRRGRRRRDARPARPLQRAGGELLRRDGGRVRAPAGADRRRRRVEPRHEARQGDGRAAAAARRRRRDEALGRRAPPRRAVPAAARRARPAAARRADEPPRRRVGRLARAAPGGLQGHDRRGHPRSLLPRQRRGLDPRARPRPRASRSRATTPAGSSRSRSGSRRRSARSPRASARSPRSSSGCA